MDSLEEFFLTKSNLLKRGWTGTSNCQFCQNIETVDHLFVQCSWVRQIWFSLGQCQDIFSNWQTIEGVIHYADSLQHHNKHAFLNVFSALQWTVWKIRNDVF